MNITLPETVSDIIKELQNAGFEAYAVGGCVRDCLLGRTPSDWDITTSAKPFQVKRIFRRTVDTGILHGTVTVLAGGEAFEVTTYRTDGQYLDGRHPESVTFVSSLAEDLRRRDFTINAMAFNEEEGLVDLFGGWKDLQEGTVRCVGVPEERFSEDALRILRAVRFAAQLSFAIEPETAEAIRRKAPTLSKISVERICTELIKLITSPHPEYLKTAADLGLTRVFLPEFDRALETSQNSRYHQYSVGMHTLVSMQNIAPDKTLRLTMLLHDLGKPLTKTTDVLGADHFKGHGEAGTVLAHDILRRLKMDNDTIRKVTTLVRYHDWRFPAEEKNVRRALNVLGEELFPMFLKVQLADTMAKSTYRREEMLEHLAALAEMYKKIIREGQCISLKTLAVSGRDVIQSGEKPGPAVGERLQEALELVLEDPARNDREFLMKFLKEKINSGGAV